MAERGRRTRPWGPLKGPTQQHNELAALLRDWLNDAGLRLDDLVARLTADHFTDTRVPSRSTVAARLSGVALDEAFVEAVADVCSTDAAGRERLLRQARAVKSRAVDASDTAAGPLSAASSTTAGLAGELLAVQRQSLAAQDKLVRAWERATELERERTNANQMVVVLLTMVDKLQRDIGSLSAERDRLRGRPAQRKPLEQVRMRLARSERQRQAAEAELQRARDERHKADRLAEQAQDQIKTLTAELERLRPPASPPAEDLPQRGPATADTMADDTSADDIDQALAKAGRHLDDGADRLDRLAEELHQDNPPDNSLTSTVIPDNETDTSAAPGPDDIPLRYKSAEHFALEQEVLGRLRAIHAVPKFFEELVLDDSVELALNIMGLLLVARGDHQDIVHDMLVMIGHRRTPTDIPIFAGSLRDAHQDSAVHGLLSAVGRMRRPDQLVAIVNRLRDTYQAAHAYQVLTAVGRERPPEDMPAVLKILHRGDAEWVLSAVERERSTDRKTRVADALNRAGHVVYAHRLTAPWGTYPPALADAAYLDAAASYDTLVLRLPVSRDTSWEHLAQDIV
ncbi:hypothetical protein ACIRU8_43040 [Streptomyces sp. NPDC101175]|uniref:hypothetical protein n=1 Tax=Streptomyces sp. NPDC101175 TaxID=3366123 RepID=UPI00383617AD